MRLNVEDKALSCFFRSFADPPQRKALMQITERCNLNCAHCFISSGDYGDAMEIKDIENAVIPRLEQCRVNKITLTGGEPFRHPDIVDIVKLFQSSGMRIGICSNATLISPEQISELAEIGDVHINVSLDGFRPESHNRFRGTKGTFETAIKTIKELSRAGLLQGFLTTPNQFAEPEEYFQLCKFARNNKAKYVLMNPLSNLGRGTKSKSRVATPDDIMDYIKLITEKVEDIEKVYVRFPNKDLPLTGCNAGNIIYVFVRGEIAVCPYLVFATNTLASKHSPSEFIVGNIFTDADIAERLDAYNLKYKYNLGDNPTCNICRLNDQCDKGCPAAIISSGQHIEGVDKEVCPMIGAD